MPIDSSESADSLGLTVDALDHISLTVGDLEASRKWYSDILGFKSLQTDPDIFVPYVSNGMVDIALQPVRDGVEFAPPSHQGSRFTHAAFRVDSAAYEAYKKHLPEKGIEYEELIHTDSRSIYFSDPDGYVIEVTTYET